MLGSRTKQVHAYGRRGHRIVNIPEDRDYLRKIDDDKSAPAFSKSSTTSKRENIISHSPSPTKRVRRKRPIISSPISVTEPSRYASITKKLKKSPKVAKVAKAQAIVPLRQPLATYHVNLPGSPAISPAVRTRRLANRKATPLKIHSPIVNVDIIVLDDDGHRLSQEHRISRVDVQANPSKTLETRPNRFTRITNINALAHSDSEDYESPIKPIKRGGNRLRPIVISSDESDSDLTNGSILCYTPSSVVEISSSNRHPKRAPIKQSVISPSPSIISESVEDEPSTPTMSPSFVLQTSSAESLLSPIAKPLIHPLVSDARKQARPLTPLRARSGRSSIFPRPPSPPSPTTPTDLDLSFDFAELHISSYGAAATDAHTAPPEYLRPLLAECSQESLHEFSAFIEMFPFDPIVQTHSTSTAPVRFQKIGEASYSEVFGIGDVVLKVIPVRNEDTVRQAIQDDVDSPAPSDAKDVLKEMIVTRAMGELCEGFVKLLRTYIVRGKYPSLLLDLWDEYHERKGSESVRPDSFNVSQTYAIIVLPNGGPDLEAYAFPATSKNGWQKACSLFWQVTRILAQAEQLVHFEHRDLHWGQILVKETPVVLSRRSTSKKNAMDHSHHGIKVTVIDLGLARMESGEDTEDAIQWTPFDDEVFEGEGDYQFDVYRMMRIHNGDSWEEYRPLTNVMWLHYLVRKLLHSKRLRVPAPPRKNAASAPLSATYTEQECYSCLVEMENLLSTCLADIKPTAPGKKGRRTVPVSTKPPIGPKNAAEVLKYAVVQGWVR